MRDDAFAWPDGHRVAVLVSLLLETWSEGSAPSYFPRTTPLRQGCKDIAGINWSRFGGNEGLWRLTRIVQDFCVPATLFCNGRAVEVFPEAIAAFIQTGNTLAGHGYLQDQTLAYLSPDEERAAIRKTLEIIQKACGQRPTGWLTPIYGQSERTLDYLVQEKLAWSSDALDSSMPYRQKTASGSIVMIPWSDFVDNRALRASPRIYFDVYKDTLDYLAAYEPGGLIHIGIHSHFGGRPFMAAAFRQILEYYRAQKGVWFARPDEIANWMAGQNAESASYAHRFFQDDRSAY